jgi:hypothetical protein
VTAREQIDDFKLLQYLYNITVLNPVSIEVLKLNCLAALYDSDQYWCLMACWELLPSTWFLQPHAVAVVYHSDQQSVAMEASAVHVVPACIEKK